MKFLTTWYSTLCVWPWTYHLPRWPFLCNVSHAGHPSVPLSQFSHWQIYVHHPSHMLLRKIVLFYGLGLLENCIKPTGKFWPYVFVRNLFWMFTRCWVFTFTWYHNILRSSQPDLCLHLGNSWKRVGFQDLQLSQPTWGFKHFERSNFFDVNLR